ncbi:MAG: FG-GAP-like repeat-containing protein [Rhizobacter sp.]
MKFSCLEGTSRVQRGLRRALMVGSIVFVAACGGGGDDAAPDAVADGLADTLAADIELDARLSRGGVEYFPLGSNDQWVYRAADESLVKFKVTGRERVGAFNTTIVSHNVPGFDPFEQARFVVEGHVVRQVPGPEASAILQALGPLDVMRFPLTPGQRFVQIDRTVDSGVDIDGDGRTDALRIHSVVTMVGFDITRVEAALFPRTAHLRTQIEQTITASSSGVSSTLSATLDDWYAPGVGLVRSRALYREGDFVQSGSQSLLAYRVGGRRSDLLAPVVTAQDPAPRSLHGSRTVVNVDFNEPLDSDALTPTSLTVVNARGVNVPGAIALVNNRLSFQPANTWPSGTYTVQLRDGLVDFTGNALRPRSWTFNVEAEAPTAVSLSPASGAQDVSLAPTLRAQFSEALAPASVPGNVRLVDLATNTDVPVTVSLANARTVVIQPQARLQRGMRYVVQFSSAMTDLRGNPVLMNQPWSFSTDPGMFSYPSLVSPQWAPEAVAIGDVNNDGLDDVVMTTYFSFDPANDFKLVVYLQRADGTLAEPVRYANAGSYGCKSNSLAIADLDGDGRKDIAIGQGGCGVEIFLQRTDGTLASGNWLPSANSHRVRAVDVTGDGLADIVGAGADTREVSVWTQVGGRISLPAVYAVEHTGGGDLDVGDLNGDGRPDIVVTSPTGEATRSIGVLLQQPDGRFAAPTYLGVDGTSPARGARIGDLNGDGRRDLVVSWGGSAPAALSVFYQRADGTLAPPVSRASLDYPGALAVADLNGDGRLDVVVAHDGWRSVGVYLQGVDGVLGEEERYEGTDGSGNLQGVAVGDVNGDGRPDIAQAGLSLMVNRGAPSSAPAMNGRLQTATSSTPLRWWTGVAGRAVPAPAKNTAR